MVRVVSICLLVVLSFSPAQTSKVAAAGFNDASSVCIYIAENDKNRLRKLLKELRIKLRSLYEEMTCNGENLLQFAMSRKADDIGVFMIKKIPVSVLKEKGDLEWANANGHGDSEIAKALVERLNS